MDTKKTQKTRSKNFEPFLRYLGIYLVKSPIHFLVYYIEITLSLKSTVGKFEINRGKISVEITPRFDVNKRIICIALMSSNCVFDVKCTAKHYIIFYTLYKRVRYQAGWSGLWDVGASTRQQHDKTKTLGILKMQ